MNLPPLDLGEKILFAGLGSGFDIFGAIPLWVKLREDEKKFIFTNCNLAAKKFNEDVYPESSLKQILIANEMDVPVYTLPKTGVKSQREMFETIVEEHQPDTIIAVDGGVDSLMHGDEEGCGTIIEDFISLAALDLLPIKKKYVVCCGFGTELEEGVCHHSALENIALLIAQGGFLGCCSLLKDTKEFKIYKDVCEFVWSKGSRKSHIHTRVISAALGKFGDDNLYDNIWPNLVGQELQNYILPLMPIYWFFDFNKVIANNKLIHLIRDSISSVDVSIIYKQFLANTEMRKRKSCF